MCEKSVCCVPAAERCMQAHRPLYTFFFIKKRVLWWRARAISTPLYGQKVLSGVPGRLAVLGPPEMCLSLHQKQSCSHGQGFPFSGSLALSQIHFQTRSLARSLSLLQRPSLSLALSTPEWRVAVRARESYDIHYPCPSWEVHSGRPLALTWLNQLPRHFPKSNFGL